MVPGWESMPAVGLEKVDQNEGDGQQRSAS